MYAICVIDWMVAEGTGSQWGFGVGTNINFAERTQFTIKDRSRDGAAVSNWYDFRGG
jgi:hypothetical protein